MLEGGQVHLGWDGAVLAHGWSFGRRSAWVLRAEGTRTSASLHRPLPRYHPPWRPGAAGPPTLSSTAAGSTCLPRGAGALPAARGDLRSGQHPRALTVPGSLPAVLGATRPVHAVRSGQVCQTGQRFIRNRAGARLVVWCAGAAYPHRTRVAAHSLAARSLMYHGLRGGREHMARSTARKLADSTVAAAKRVTRTAAAGRPRRHEGRRPRRPPKAAGEEGGRQEGGATKKAPGEEGARQEGGSRQEVRARQEGAGHHEGGARQEDDRDQEDERRRREEGAAVKKTADQAEDPSEEGPGERSHQEGGDQEGRPPRRPPAKKTAGARRPPPRASSPSRPTRSPWTKAELRRGARRAQRRPRTAALRAQPGRARARTT